MKNRTPLPYPEPDSSGLVAWWWGDLAGLRQEMLRRPVSQRLRASEFEATLLLHLHPDRECKDRCSARVARSRRRCWNSAVPGMLTCRMHAR